MLGLLDGARCSVQIDIGFGDAVTPAPENVQYRVMLDGMPQPQLRGYPRYTVVAEKLEAMAKLGILNSRMKDYFDLWVLARHSDFDGVVLATAIRATFERRGTDIPSGLPLGLTDEFALHEQKNMQWSGFVRKNALGPIALTEVIGSVRQFLLPVLAALAEDVRFDRQWRASAGWDVPTG
jgi:hypothetical protein